jgi:serine protease AprX
MRVAETFVRPTILLCILAALGAPAFGEPRASSKLDRALQHRAASHRGRSAVIVHAAAGVSPGVVGAALRRLGGTKGRALPLIGAHAGELPSAALDALAESPWIDRISEDRLVAASMERSGATVGADAVRESLGYDGAGVGVAIVDSGIAPHDDLPSQRVTRFVDFVNGRAAQYDDHGHGTHVAGIVSGSGYDSGGARTGIAPAAHLIVLKVLDASGRGRISDVIAALDYVVANRTSLKIGIVNLSIRAGVYESYDSDPLTLATRRAVREGIVVVAAGGNLGRRADGRMQYGGITAPGNAPWVLTVGASSHMGTAERADDRIATFSSRGPGSGGYTAKPDLVAPGVGIESLSAPHSTLYASRTAYLLGGTLQTPFLPYLSLSGTSMAAPVVTGTVALMLQANPALTPNLVKAILQYTAEASADYDALTQGAGFLNAKGAVQLARHLASPVTEPFPAAGGWSGRLIWGNRLVQGGRLTPEASAWPPSVVWGALRTPSGKAARWGVICTTDCDAEAAQWTAWETSSPSVNVVWGSACGGDDCPAEWSLGAAASSDGVVWGMDNDSVVWGLSDEGVVWGLSDDGVVWGLDCPDESCEPVLWASR